MVGSCPVPEESLWFQRLASDEQAALRAISKLLETNQHVVIEVRKSANRLEIMHVRRDQQFLRQTGSGSSRG